MIFNFIKHLVMALLLDAGAALAFDVEADAPAVAATSAAAARQVASPASAETIAPAAQSCALPLATVTDGANVQAANLNDTGTRS